MIRTYSIKGDLGLSLPVGADLFDAAFSIPTKLLSPPASVTYFCSFSAGQNAGLVDGVTLTGQTSGNVFHINGVIIGTGTLAGSSATGLLLIQSSNGAPTSGENLRVGTDTYCVARSTRITTSWFAGKPARQLVYICETNAIRWFADGQTPTNSAATPASWGNLLNPGDVGVWDTWKTMVNLKMINAVSTSNAAGVLNVYF